jgi:DNA (cytosine-5)-methyltransferase 1
LPCIVDLFSGAGGLSLGAARAGFQVAAAVELDKFACETHALNFPLSKHFQLDLSKTSASELAHLLLDNDIQRVDGVIGGPPCQGFSSIGQKDILDDRNILFVKFFEFVAAVKPDFFIAENVPGILNSKYDEVRNNAFSFVENYELLKPLSIKASEYGAPTTRTRIFFIGYKKDKIASLEEADFKHAKISSVDVKEALTGLPPHIRYSKNHSGKREMLPNYINNGSYCNHFFHSRVFGKIPEGVGDRQAIEEYCFQKTVTGCFPTKHRDDVRKRYSKVKCGKSDRVSKSPRLSEHGLCPTLRAGTGPEKGSYQAVRPIHYQFPRVITPREAARLQGFPDWFIFQPTIWHSFRQIGNSVSPLVSERIMSVIFQKLTS